jgi:rubrerythrin
MAIKFSELISKINEKQDVFQQLKKAINDEFLAFLQYSAGIGTCHCDQIKKSFKEKADDEFRHVRMFYEIIQDLGGTYVFKPADLLLNNDCAFAPPFGDGINKIKDNIKSEQCVIASYSTILKLCDFNEKHTKIIKSIIAEEQQHVDELVKLLKKKKKEQHN